MTKMGQFYLFPAWRFEEQVSLSNACKAKQPAG
jgi:hypothetical protein